MSGVGGGLRLFERRASSCKKGIGENRGVLGALWRVEPSTMAERPAENCSDIDSGGKESYVDVTSSVFSTARRYLPTD